MKDLKLAKSCFGQSDSIAGVGDAIDNRHPVLQLYYEWKMALASASPTRAKIAFGRLKVLRSGSSVECRSRAFDDYVERGRSEPRTLQSPPCWSQSWRWEPLPASPRKPLP